MILENIIGYQKTAKGEATLKATNPSSQKKLPETFVAATLEEVDQAVNQAFQAWKVYRNISGVQKALFIRKIAEEIELLGNTLVQRVIQETGLPEGRVIGERGRTCNQLRLFAQLVEEGNWVEASIDHAQPNRQPNSKPDIRKMLMGMGPVAVFTASNFPLAFSTAGGDTAAALAAGCPVIVKAHESHLGTNALVAECIQRAAQGTNMPEGVFSSLNAEGYDVGKHLVQHPLLKGVAFTGSQRGGMAIYKMAAERKEPIPVFAEMGSINPVFLLPEKLKEEAENLANTLANSCNLGAGQFCTNPGLIVLLENEEGKRFLNHLKLAFEALVPATMLNESIFLNFEKGKNHFLNASIVKEELLQHNGFESHWKAYPGFASVNALDFLKEERLQEEVFGPFSLIVKCQSKQELEAVAESLQGQLTATIFGTKEELPDWSYLFHTLQEKVGRLIFNVVPTGVEVCASMHHGGPFPASTDSRFTSVGTDAIKRFARPIVFQNCPEEMLPEALREGNALGISRRVF